MKWLSQGKEKLIHSYLTLRAPVSSRLPVKSVFLLKILISTFTLQGVTLSIFKQNLTGWMIAALTNRLSLADRKAYNSC